jgi:multiple sugar transport system substrate-binding protein
MVFRERIYTIGLVFIVALLSAVAGCQSQPEESRPRATRLVFWHGIESMTSSGILTDKIEQFQKIHPDVVIELQHYGAADQVMGKVMTAIAGNRPPDMMWWGPQALGYLARSGALVNIQHFIDRDPGFDPEDIYEKLWQQCRYESSLYAVPFDTNNLGIYYNRRHFEIAKIDPENLQTWEDLLRAARKLTRDTDGDHRIDRYGFQIPLGNGEWTVWTWQTFLWQAGGEFLSPDHSRVLFYQDAGIRALRFWVELVHKHLAANFSEPGAGYKVDDFLAGRISMMINGPWNFHLLESAAQKNGFRYGSLPLPHNVRPATNIGGENLYLFKSEPQREKAAWSFAKFILSPQFQLDWAMQTGYLPVNRRVMEKADYQEFLQQYPFIRTFVDQMPFGRSRPTIPEYAKISSKLGKQIEIALYQKATPENALREAADYADAVLNPN